MCDRLHVEPSAPRTNVPITVTSHGELAETSAQVRVSPVDNRQLDSFVVPAKITDGHLLAQFTVSLPGLYEVAYGAKRTTVVVEQQKDLEFSTEFGLFSIAVLLLVGAMILWLHRRKTTPRPGAGSF